MKHKKIVVLLLLGFCLILGFWMRIVSNRETIVPGPIRADAADYYFYAYNLRHNHTYSRHTPPSGQPSSEMKPDALRTPGYPIFLLPFVNSFPTARIIHRIVFFQALISTLAILVAFAGFRRMLPDQYCIIACGLMAISPHLITANLYILTESLFGFIIVLCVWNITKFFKTLSMKCLWIASILMGIGILVRPSLQFFPIFLTPFWIWHYGKLKGFHFFAITVLGIALVLMPWYIRNIISLGKISDDTLKLSSIQHGIYPNFTYNNLPESYGFPYRFDPKTKEISRSTKTLLQEIYRRFQDEPMKHAKWFFYQKMIAFWSWDSVPGTDVFIYPVKNSPYFHRPIFIATHKLMHFLHWPLNLFCFTGCFLIWLPMKRDVISYESIQIARFISVILIYYTLLHMICAPFPRYSVPLRPLTYGMAVFLIFFSLQLFKKRNRRFSEQK
ncbi:MAG: hypothetical protein C0403_02825 [Desulfobacterium sp.]|nr:hypothetical protein [Desulfobacterium sp.]